MTTSAQARTYLAQIQDLVDRFAVLFPSWPSLTPARASITRAARQLDQLDNGQNPTSPDNPDPAGTIINPPYSFLHFMATTAGATDANQLLDPLTGRALIIDAPTGTIAETIAHYQGLMARAEQIRARGGRTTPTPAPAAPDPSPTPTPSTPPTPAPTPAITAQAAPVLTTTGQGAAQAASQAPGPSWTIGAPAASYAPSAYAEATTPTTATAQAAPSSAQATGGNWLPILLVGLVGLAAFGGKKGGRQ